MPDEQLVQLARSAAAGRPCPPIRVVTIGGDFISGVPGLVETFNEAMRRALIKELKQTGGRSLGLRDRSAKKQAEAEVNEQAANTAIALFGTPTDTTGHGALTLLDARIIRSGRTDGLQVPAVKVPLESIATWWITGAKVVKGESASSWFVGGLFPIGNN